MPPSESEKQIQEAQSHLGTIIRDLYNQMATTYEDHLRDDCQYTLPATVAKLLAPIAKTHTNFLELAVGPGNIGKAIAEAGIDLRLTGADFSENMLRMIDCPLYHSRIQLDATHPMPFEDNTFDGALFILLMEHITDPLLVFQQVYPVIRRGGLLLFTFMPSQSENVEMLEHESTLISHPREMVHRELASAGFTLLKEYPLDTYIHGDEWRVHNLILALKE